MPAAAPAQSQQAVIALADDQHRRRLHQHRDLVLGTGADECHGLLEPESSDLRFEGWTQGTFPDNRAREPRATLSEQRAGIEEYRDPLVVLQRRNTQDATRFRRSIYLRIG